MDRIKYLRKVIADCVPKLLVNAPGTIDPFIRYAAKFAANMDINFRASYVSGALVGLKKTDIFDFFRFLDRDDWAPVYACLTGKEAYAQEGFSAFEKRRDFYNLIPHPEHGISAWILKEGEQYLSRESKKAEEYVKFMGPVIYLEPLVATEIFQRCNRLFEFNDPNLANFPNKVVSLAKLDAYRKLDQKQRYEVLHLLEDLYRKDTYFGGNRQDTFLGAVMSLDAASASELMTSCGTNNELRQSLGLPKLG